MQVIGKRRWVTCGAEQTQALGVALGRHAQAGDFIACRGALGAGKTTFIQGFARGLGVSSDAYVRSPTFMLVNEYAGRCPLYHFDFYRLQEAREVLDIGFDDYCLGTGVVVVEWADKFPELLPEKRLDLSIETMGNDQRTICAMASDHAYTRYIDPMAHELGT